MMCSLYFVQFVHFGFEVVELSVMHLSQGEGGREGGGVRESRDKKLLIAHSQRDLEYRV